MVKIDRHGVRITHTTTRYIAEKDVAVAKEQAYLLRDLIEKHHGQRLKGGDATDCFALLFHGMDWASLVAHKRGQSEGEYYGFRAGLHLGNTAQELRDLIPTLKSMPVRPLLDMPRPQYSQPRTKYGAKIATLIAGRPSWCLEPMADEDCITSGRPLVYDMRNDLAYAPNCFSSDPMTNEERLYAVCLQTGKPVQIPVQKVAFTPYKHRHEEYSLEGHVPSKALGSLLYHQALGNSMGRHWFNHGNDLNVTVFKNGAIQRVHLSDFADTEATRDYDKAMYALREFFGMPNFALIPLGLDEVRNPEERWNPSFKYTKEILPDVDAADLRYQKALESLGDQSDGSKSAIDRLAEATREYNDVLMKAVDAYWKDTREINSRERIIESLGTQNPDADLCFRSNRPPVAIRELIGLAPKR